VANGLDNAALDSLIFFEWKSGIRTHDFHSFFAITERVGLCNHVRTSIFLLIIISAFIYLKSTYTDEKQTYEIRVQ